MKKLILFSALVFMIGCEEKEPSADKLFDYNDIELLKLTNLDGFWVNNSEIDISYHFGVVIESDSGFIGGIRLNSESNEIEIVVFNTQSNAINCMEEIIRSSSAVIVKGNSDVIKGSWWYTLSKYGVWVNRNNTLISVSSSNANYEGAEDIIHATANEVAKRVDNLSR